jgi:hypothetical protein
VDIITVIMEEKEQERRGEGSWEWRMASGE